MLFLLTHDVNMLNIRGLAFVSASYFLFTSLVLAELSSGLAVDVGNTWNWVLIDTK